MQKIIDYDILYKIQVSDLNELVKQKIKEGWQPFGAPYVRVWNEGAFPVVEYQAMVKYEEDKDEGL